MKMIELGIYEGFLNEDLSIRNKSLNDLPDNDLYHLTLKLQYEMWGKVLEKELGHFFSAPEMTSVLDVGHGPGIFAETMSGHLTNKDFEGIDINEEFINISKRRFDHCPKMSFQCIDFFDLKNTKKYHLIMLMAVLQHLGDITKVLQKIEDLTKPENTILVFDTHDDILCTSEMNLPKLNLMYSELNRKVSKVQRNRECLHGLWEKVKMKNKKIHCFKKTSYSGDADNFVLFNLYQMALSEFFKRFFHLDVDQKSLEHELFKRKSSDRVKITGGGILVFSI